MGVVSAVVQCTATASSCNIACRSFIIVASLRCPATVDVRQRANKILSENNCRDTAINYSVSQSNNNAAVNRRRNPLTIDVQLYISSSINNILQYIVVKFKNSFKLRKVQETLKFAKGANS